jgi:N-formylglutamate deformylase
MSDWLHVTRGDAPLIVSIPHAGTTIPDEIEARLISPWLARKDADWHVDQLYAFAAGLGATIVRTGISRTVIDVNRDPSGKPLYPGQAGTALCPVTTFAGEPLYLSGKEPNQAETDERRRRWFDPYHGALRDEVARLHGRHEAVALYDAHSIPSRVPRLFDGELPHLNIGTNGGGSCAPEIAAAVATICDASAFSSVCDGRFRGGWITRHLGRPDEGLHAIQMELSMRGYLAEPEEARPDNWPPAYDPRYAMEMQKLLRSILCSILDSVSCPA